MNGRPRTTALVWINAAVLAAMVLTGVSPFNPTPEDLLKWGGNIGPLSLGSQPWRMLTANYLHAGIIHLGFNMWCLWNLGALAERIFNPLTFFLVYTACGLAGSLASLYWHPHVVGVGASGAIFGLAGALISALYLGRLPVPREAIRGTLRSLVSFAGYNLVFGAVVPGIDNSAHIGGFAAGLAIGAALAADMAPSQTRGAWRRGVFIAVAIALTTGFVMVRRINGPEAHADESLPG
ncbi:MAG: rhomboid family intramembrane serine protease [Elusimicrobiota bacterium]